MSTDIQSLKPRKQGAFRLAGGFPGKFPGKSTEEGRRIRLWPRGLVGRVMLVLLASIGLVFGGATTLYEQAETYSIDDDRIDLIGERLVTDARVLVGTSRAQRPVLAVMLSTADLSIDWGGPEQVEDLIPETKGLRSLHQEFTTADPTLAGHSLHLRQRPGRPTDVTGTLILSDGSTLHFVAPDILRSHRVTRGIASAAIVATAVLLAAAMIVHTLSLPLRTLAAVADTVGSGSWQPLAERGPREVRRLAHAINAMQQRISQLISDRTEGLAAVSHDLRTPLARLRLRAGFLADGETQSAIEADLDEMEAMIDGVLSYLSGEKSPEAARVVDLASLLSTIADDATDQGRSVVYIGPDRAPARLAPLSMKRVFNNLVENALHYAGSARINLRADPQELVIEIEDDGPGIPPEELARVTTAFYRLEGSRSRQTGGLGLGLAIVKREVERAQGRFELQNRAEGGLVARVRLPQR